MRIGIMLRCLDEHGGISIYGGNMVRELLRQDSQNDYILYYRSPDQLGRFAEHPNVIERVIRPASKPIWDQVAIPINAWKDRIDVLFHPKFTVPLLSPCRAVMVVHGADWFIPEHAQYYGWLDVRYIKLMMPLYFRKAQTVISVSKLTTRNFERVLDLPEGKIQTIYFGPARNFKPTTDAGRLAEVRARYELPDKFIFALTKAGGGDRKNFGHLLEAYRLINKRAPHKLVVGGKDLEQFRSEYSIPDGGFGSDVLFPGWIEQADLPAVYSLADLFLYPSNVEAFPIPITEAMACGTPIVTSDANGLREIANDAALFVDQNKPSEIADAVHKVLTDATLRETLRTRGLARAEEFSWEKCARETLALLTDVSR